MDQQWAVRRNELRDAQLVTQRQVGELSLHISRIGALVLPHENDIAEIRAEMRTLISNIKRFLRGRGRNGQES